MFKNIIDFVKNRLASKGSSQSWQVPQESYENIHHLAFVIDGHRRWAKLRGLSIAEGYDKVLELLPPLLEFGWESGIHTITVSLLSPDNIAKRPSSQLEILYKMFDQLLDLMLEIAMQLEVKVVHLGRKDGMPRFFIDKIIKLEQQTEIFDKHIFNMAINYSGRDEVVHAAKRLVELGVTADQITEAMLDKLMYAGGQKHIQPDLIIRCGNSMRLSGFMCWNLGSSELYFSKKLFPDFTINDFKEAIREFQNRERRFGG